MTERWMPVFGFESHYEISDIGRVRRIASESGTHVGKINKPGIRGNYLKYTLSVAGIISEFSAHRLVWEAFNGRIPAGSEINHKNGIKHDNRLINLETCTRSENRLHAIRVLGFIPNACPHFFGSAHPLAVVNEDQIREIRKLYAAGGITQQTLADRFGTDQTNISDIVRRKTWRHVA